MTNDSKIYTVWWWFLSLEGKVTKKVSFLKLLEMFYIYLFVCVYVSVHAWMLWCAWSYQNNSWESVLSLSVWSAASPSPPVSCQPVFQAFVTPFSSICTLWPYSFQAGPDVSQADLELMV